MGSWEEALEALKEASNLEPGSAMIAFVNAQAHRLVRRYPEALHYIDLAINLDPDFTSSYSEKIRLSMQWKGNTENARKVLEEASLIIKPPSDLALKHYLIIFEIYDGNYYDAIKLLDMVDFEAVQSQFDYHPKSLIMAGVYNLLQDEVNAHHYYNLSRGLLEKKISEDPEDSRLYGALGISYAGLGEKNSAIQYGMKAIQMMPVKKEAFRGIYRESELARIFVMVGEYGKAIEKLDYLLSIPGVLSVKLLQLDPVWKPLWDHPEFKRLIEKYSKIRK
jgi:tetratricopeptide (TPR) repeat protein